MSSILSDIKESMYEYEVLTAQQLGIIHSYEAGKNSIYPLISKLYKNDEIRKVNVPAIGRGSKAYFLTLKAARKAAEARQEEHLFKEKDWESAPGSILNILMTNQFFCEIIRHSREIPESGLSDWIGRRSLAHRYAIEYEDKKEEKKAKSHRMHGYGVFYHEGLKRLIHLEVFTGNETMPVMQDKLESHYHTMKLNLQDTTKALLLVIYLGSKTGERALKIWNKITQQDGKAPYFAVAHFEEIVTEGVFAPLWLHGIDKIKASILDMPGVKQHSYQLEDMIGKQKKIKFKFKTIKGFEDLDKMNIQDATDNKEIEHVEGYQENVGTKEEKDIEEGQDMQGVKDKQAMKDDEDVKGMKDKQAMKDNSKKGNTEESNDEIYFS